MSDLCEATDDHQRDNADRPASQPTAKKLFIKTYGCQMNVYDSARMGDVLAPLGYAPTATPGPYAVAPSGAPVRRSATSTEPDSQQEDQ